MNTRLRRALSLFITIIFLVVVLFLIFRNPLLHWRLEKLVVATKAKTDATLDIKSASFSGLFTVSMHDISLVPRLGDTLFQADTMQVRLSLWLLLRGSVRIKELYASGINVTVSCRDSICNFKNLYQKKQLSSSKPESDLSVFFKTILDKAFNLAPQRANVIDASFVFRNDTINRIFRIKQFHSDENSLYGNAEDLLTHSSWKAQGKFSQIKHSLQLKIFSADSGNIKLPLTNELVGLTLGFDTFNFELNGYNWKKNLLSVEGKISADKLILFHKKISDDTVKVSSSSFNFLIHTGKSFIEIDSSSNASLSSINFHPYVRYNKDNNKEYQLKIITGKIPATDFFSSLPQGIFDEVRDISAKGTLQFALSFKINSSQPDSLVFESSLKKEKFRINDYGSSNLSKMNGEFSHSVYEKDRFIRSFIVGYSNPFYAPLVNISPSFINAVLTSEDGNFYFHNGFNEDAFRQSIIANYKAGKFVRGGSTISMQLVKNVFLNRKKTIARKAEEALLVWLIESNRITGKERMLEVYMNIIELGPGIYGIGEASDFYFKKRPIELTLPEGIFLASLLPHPKWFKYSFDSIGNLKPYLADYYRLVSDFMLRKNLITQEEHDNLKPNILLIGPAREMVVPSDTIPEEEDETELN